MRNALSGLLFLVATFLQPSCHGENERLLPDQKLQELKTYVGSAYKIQDPANNLDSFRLIRIDTMSHKQFLEAQRSSLYDDYDDFSNEGKELLDEYKLKIRQTKLAAELSSSLFSLYKGQALDLKVKLQDHNDRFTALLKKDTLLTLQIAKADSIKTVGYQAVCFYQMRRKDQSVKKDTTFVPLNADKNIVERQDF